MGLYRRGKIYWFSITCQGRRIQESLDTKNRKLAEKLYAKKLTEIVEEKRSGKPKDVTMAQAIERYIDEVSPLLSPSTHERNNQVAEKLKTAFGSLLIGDVSASAISGYKAERLQNVKPSTVKKELALLRRVFNLAIDEWELCTNNPVKKVIKSIRFDDARVRYVTPKEARKLRLTLPAWLMPIVIVAAQTGLRQGNILGLKEEQVDFGLNMIIVPKTKNGKPVAVPMTSAVRETLSRVIRAKKAESQYLFCDENGRPHSGKKVSVAFKRACKRAGVKDLRFHDLKHDFATSLVQAGIDLYRIQKLCGHTDQRMTQRYAHLLPEGLREAIKGIESKGTATILLQSGDTKGVTSP